MQILACVALVASSVGLGQYREVLPVPFPRFDVAPRYEEDAVSPSTRGIVWSDEPGSAGTVPTAFWQCLPREQIPTVLWGTPSRNMSGIAPIRHALSLWPNSV